MGHFAKINEENIVEEVIVVNNTVLLDEDGLESELKGQEFLNTTFGSANWIQTSYNNIIRKNYAGIGYTYDLTKDAFIAPKPFTSWILDEDTCQWKSPIDYPDDGKIYSWNEDNQSWDLL